MKVIEQYDDYVGNMTPGLESDLIAELDNAVSREAIQQLGIGFDLNRQAFVFPERNSQGVIVGVSYRVYGGNKFMAEGSKRGLIYPAAGIVSNSKQYRPGAHNWIRCTPDLPCPICGRVKYCSVSSANPHDPPAVMCTKVKEGSDPTYKHEHNYLHILKPEGNLRSLSSPLPPSGFPVFIVEGASDVLAAMTLGFVSVGKPSNKGGRKFLPDLVRGRKVIVWGENDGGPGEEGMYESVALLQQSGIDARPVLPPPHFKDFRKYAASQQLTVETVMQYVEANCIEKPDNPLDAKTFVADDPVSIGRKWLDAEWSKDGEVTLRYHLHRYVGWNGRRYEPLSNEQVRGSLYSWLDGSRIILDKRGGPEIVPYIPNRTRVGNILDALNSVCPVNGNAPMWLNDTEADPRNLIAFNNGIIDISTWRKYTPTPLFFSYNSLPYDYTPDIDTRWWEDVLDDIFNGDDEKIQLLQQWFGYNMVADTSQEKLMILIGPPRSGKGTVLTALETILGDGQICATSLEALCGPFGFEPLLGKLAATLGDATMPRGYGVTSALEKLLNITGEDGVQVNCKGKPALERVKLMTRFTIALNLFPSLQDHANALAPRLNILEFKNSYSGREDFGLKRRIKNRGESICIWALRGLLDLRESGRFVEPHTSKKLKDDFARLSTPMLAFINDCCEVASDNCVADRDLRYCWNEWSIDHSVYRISGESFKQRLRAVCPGVRPCRLRLKDTTIAGWKGIQLKDEAQENYMGRPTN